MVKSQAKRAELFGYSGNPCHHCTRSAMMLLGGLRRCEVLGLRFQDLQPGERRVLVADGKGGHQRLIPISTRFFTNLASYIADERPQTTSDRVFVVLKGPHRGQPLYSGRAG